MPGRELSNGVSEEGLKTLVTEDGYTAEVVCMDPVRYTGPAYHGRWHIRAVSPDGGDEWVLVTQRDPTRPRDIKTIVGLIRMLLDLGFDSVSLPMHPGGRAANRPRKPIASSE